MTTKNTAFDACKTWGVSIECAKRMVGLRRRRDVRACAVAVTAKDVAGIGGTIGHPEDLPLGKGMTNAYWCATVKCGSEPPGVAPQTAVKGSSTSTSRHFKSRKISPAQSQSSDVVSWVRFEDACEEGFGVPRARRGAQTEGAPRHHQPGDMQSGSPQRSYLTTRTRKVL